MLLDCYCLFNCARRKGFFLAFALILSGIAGCCGSLRQIDSEEQSEYLDERFCEFSVEGQEEMKIKCKEFGNPHGQFTILLVHGLGTSKAIWEKPEDSLKDSLTPDNRVILIDLLGHGESNKPENYTYSISEQAYILQQFISKKKLQNLIIVATSYGGATTLEAVLPLFHRGELNPVRGLVLPFTHKSDVYLFPHPTT